MKIEELNPRPPEHDTFRRSRLRFIPSASGCYVLTTMLDDVLYIGLATNLRNRMSAHLDTAQKIRTTPKGRAAFFHWLETAQINKVERTWMLICMEHEGALPILNKVFSPVAA
jgi:hypothetical protein